MVPLRHMDRQTDKQRALPNKERSIMRRKSGNRKNTIWKEEEINFHYSGNAHAAIVLILVPPFLACPSVT